MTVRLAGVTETVKSAATGGLIVKITPLLSPPAVVAVRITGPGAAEAAMLNVALIWDAAVETLETVTPAPVAASVAPLRFAPRNVTATAAPAAALPGAIEVNTGAGGMIRNVNPELVPAEVAAVMT
jgi:hypothetical protein